MFLTIMSISHVNLLHSFYVLKELNSERSGGDEGREGETEREMGGGSKGDGGLAVRRVAEKPNSVYGHSAL